MAGRSYTNIPLENLFALLRTNGFHDISTTTILDIQKVLSHLDEEEAKDPARLRYLLSPLICRNKEEQEKFNTLFDQYLQNLKQREIARKTGSFLSLRTMLILAIAFIAVGYFSYKYVIRPDSVTASPDITITYVSIGAESLTGDTVNYVADLSDTVKGGKYTINWNIDDTIYNERSIFHAFRDSGEHYVYAMLKDENGNVLKTDTSDIYINCEPTPSVSIIVNEKEDRKIYTSLPTDSVRAVNYQYKWFVGDSLASEKKDLDLPVSNLPRDIRLVADCRGLHCNRDSLTASLRDYPAYSLSATKTAPLASTDSFKGGRLAWAILFLLVIPVSIPMLLIIPWRKPKPASLKNPKEKAKEEKKPGAQKETEIEKQPDGPLFIDFKKQDHKVSPEEEISRLADGLRKRQQSDIYQLHVKKTIDKTIRAGGFPSFLFSSRTKPIDFLVLIDKEFSGGHLVHLFEYLIDRLRVLEVNIHVYDYYKEPLYLSSRKFNHTHIPIDRVAQLYPDTILLNFTRADNYFETFETELKPWVAEKFRYWDTKIIITPTPANDWSYKEELLQQRNFSLIPADLYKNDLLRILFDLIGEQLDTTNIHKIKIPGAYTTKYYNFNRFDELKTYLGDKKLIDWVSATAVYPHIDWKVTLAIGKKLEEAQPEGSDPLVTYENLLKLSRITWMEDGSIEDRLRLHMLNYIDNDTEAHARRAVVELLEDVKDQFIEPSYAKEEFDLYHNSNQFLLSKHDNQIPDPAITAAVKEYTDKGYMDWAQSTYYRKAKNTLLKSEENEGSISLEEYFDTADTGRQSNKQNWTKITLAAVLMLIACIGTGFLYKANKLQLWDIASIDIVVTVRQEQSLLQLQNMVLSLRTDSSYFEAGRENDSVYVFGGIPGDKKGKQALLSLGNEYTSAITSISLDSSYSVTVLPKNKGPRVPLVIFYNSYSRVSDISSILNSLSGNYIIDTILRNNSVGSSVITYPMSKQDKIASIINILQQTFGQTYPVVQSVYPEGKDSADRIFLTLNLNYTPPERCDLSASTLPSNLTEIWHGITNNRLLAINLGKNLLFYSTGSKTSYGTYRIDQVCQTGNDSYKLITAADNQYQVFMLRRVTVTRLDLAICPVRYATKEAALASTPSCDDYNFMEHYYEPDNEKIYMPVNSNMINLLTNKKLAALNDTLLNYKRRGIEADVSGKLYYNSQFRWEMPDNFPSNINQTIEIPENPFERSYVVYSITRKEITPTPRDSTNVPPCATFTSLKAALSNPANVCKLNLASENLSEMPHELYTMTNMKELDLGTTRIPEREIRMLQSTLKKCTIRYTVLQELVTSFNIPINDHFDFTYLNKFVRLNEILETYPDVKLRYDISSTGDDMVAAQAALYNIYSELSGRFLNQSMYIKQERMVFSIDMVRVIPEEPSGGVKMGTYRNTKIKLSVFGTNVPASEIQAIKKMTN